MKYLHTMIRIQDPEAALDFFVNKMGMKVIRESPNEAARYTNYFLAYSDDDPPLELTHNWDEKEPYQTGRFFGHLAYNPDGEQVYFAGARPWMYPVSAQIQTIAAVGGTPHRLLDVFADQVE